MTYYYTQTDEQLKRIGDEQDLLDHAPQGKSEYFEVPEDLGESISLPEAFANGGKVVEVNSTKQAIHEL